MGANTAVLHHCGNLPSRLSETPDNLRLYPIPEHIGPGAYGPTIQAAMKPGPVTLANLVGRRGTMRVSAMQAEVVPYELEFPGSAAKVAFPFDLITALETLGNSGYGHHFALIPGHYEPELAEWSALLGVGYLRVG
jgi:L-fucose isomerase-like protein